MYDVKSIMYDIQCIMHIIFLQNSFTPGILKVHYDH
jgi:hypothetical protein